MLLILQNLSMFFFFHPRMHLPGFTSRFGFSIERIPSFFPGLVVALRGLSDFPPRTVRFPRSPKGPRRLDSTGSPTGYYTSDRCKKDPGTHVVTMDSEPNQVDAWTREDVPPVVRLQIDICSPTAQQIAWPGVGARLSPLVITHVARCEVTRMTKVFLH
ncbi:unnamed protein product [Scytosiphon promiscuus]